MTSRTLYMLRCERHVVSVKRDERVMTMPTSKTIKEVHSKDINIFLTSRLH